MDVEELLDRLEGMRDTLCDEWGANNAYYRDQFNRELAPYALDLGLELLKCERPSECKE